ncbi:MAG: UDP-3-O-(3-hydroxymyristoyl)glucosamine N-acyltransferase [Gammaproteobacteria bacterium]|nr:UDP-3-O-(3-hydroxymyristoyl)glucosamine N-acyltransferase [Gammaproteobacteria bacterium]
MQLKEKYSLKKICNLLGCITNTTDRIEIDNICSIANPKKNGLSYLLNTKDINFVNNSNISIIITNSLLSKKTNKSCIITKEPLYLFSKFVYHCLKNKKNGLLSSKKNPNRTIHKSSTIAKNVVLGNDIHIGKNCEIYPNVVINDNTFIADNVIIHPGVVIGSDGFGLVIHNEKWKKVPQVGNVIIDSGVEIGANTVIDRAAIDSTIIESNVKIDNQVHIAHNVIIGENTAIAACVGIAGSTKIGKNCTIGGGTGINGHINIVDNVHIHGMAMVTKSISKPGQYASGTTIEPAASWRRNQARYKNLDKIAKLVLTKNDGDDNE